MFKNTLYMTAWISFVKFEPRFIISLTSFLHFFLVLPCSSGWGYSRKHASCRSEHQSETDNSSAAEAADFISHYWSPFVCNTSYRNTSLFFLCVKMESWFMQSWNKVILPFRKPRHYQKTNTLNHFINNKLQYSTWLIRNDNASQVWFCMLDFLKIYVKMWRCYTVIWD